MFLWWLTLVASYKPFANIAARLLLGMAVSEQRDQAQPASVLILSATSPSQSLTSASLLAGNSSGLARNSSEHVWNSLIKGVYEYEASQNFNAYLKELGVPAFLRQLASLATPVVTIDNNCTQKNFVDDCLWSIRTDTWVQSHQIRFFINQEVQDYTLDNRDVRSVFSIPSPNRLVEIQSGTPVNTTLVRDFTAKEMRVTLMANSVVSTSVFRRTSDLKAAVA